MSRKVNVEGLINMYLSGGPSQTTVLAELCEEVRRGNAQVVLDSMKTPLKKERVEIQIRMVGLLDHVVSSTGMDCLPHVATEAWMDRLVRVAKQTPFPDLKNAIERLVFKWAHTYGYPAFTTTADKMRAANPQAAQQGMNNNSMNRSESQMGKRPMMPPQQGGGGPGMPPPQPQHPQQYQQGGPPPQGGNMPPPSNQQYPPRNSAPPQGNQSFSGPYPGNNQQANHLPPGMQNASFPPMNQQQYQQQHYNVPPQQQHPPSSPSAAGPPIMVRTGGGTVTSAPPRHQHHDNIGSLDMLIMNIQADLGAVEVALQRPELMKADTVSDILIDRAKLASLLDGSVNIPASTRHNLVTLQSSIDEVIGLYNALYGPGGVQEGGGSGKAKSPRHRPPGDHANKSLSSAPPSAVQPTRIVEEVPPELIAELEAEIQRQQAKLETAKMKNGKAQQHIGKLVEEIAARKEASKTAIQKVKVVKPLPQNGVIAINARKSLALCRTLSSSLGGMKSKCENIKKEMSVCAEMKSLTNGLMGAVEFDKRQDLSSLSQLQEMYTNEMKLRKQYYNTIQELKGNIRVYCRVRPMSETEKAKHTMVTSFPADGELVVNDVEKGKNRTYEFDAVFQPTTKQESVFADTKPLIDSVVDGYNVCIFAYGQTGSGKTHTMSGPDDNIGINRRALCRLFEIVEERKEIETCTVEVAVLEIYNEEIRDLLRSKTESASLQYEVKTGGETGHYVTNLKFVDVHTEREIQELIQRASSNRSEGRTNMNQHSSRSHMILYVIVRTINKQTGQKTFGKLSLVDLAGSERLDKSGATGDMLTETVHINKSLSALGDVICNLSSGAGHVPYRNSKLTFLLQDSMTGQAKVLMFVCVSPASYNTSETLSSLEFAKRARGVSLGQAKRNVA